MREEEEEEAEGEAVLGACTVDSAALLMQTNKICLIRGLSSTAVHQMAATSSRERRQPDPQKHLESIKVFSDHRFKSDQLMSVFSCQKADIIILAGRTWRSFINLKSIKPRSQSRRLSEGDEVNVDIRRSKYPGSRPLTSEAEGCVCFLMKSTSADPESAVIR